MRSPQKHSRTRVFHDRHGRLGRGGNGREGGGGRLQRREQSPNMKNGIGFTSSVAACSGVGKGSISEVLLTTKTSISSDTGFAETHLDSIGNKRIPRATVSSRQNIYPSKVERIVPLSVHAAGTERAVSMEI